MITYEQFAFPVVRYCGEHGVQMAGAKTLYILSREGEGSSLKRIDAYVCPDCGESEPRIFTRKATPEERAMWQRMGVSVQ